MLALANRDYEGMIHGQWVRVIGEATCGCHWTLDIRQGEDNHGLSFRQCFDLYGAQFTLGQHDRSHADLCEANLPPGSLGVNIQFETPMTLKDLLEAV